MLARHAEKAGVVVAVEFAPRQHAVRREPVLPHEALGMACREIPVHVLDQRDAAVEPGRDVRPRALQHDIRIDVGDDLGVARVLVQHVAHEGGLVVGEEDARFLLEEVQRELAAQPKLAGGRVVVAAAGDPVGERAAIADPQVAVEAAGQEGVGERRHAEVVVLFVQGAEGDFLHSPGVAGMPSTRAWTCSVIR